MGGAGRGRRPVGFRQIVVELHGMGGIGAEPFAQTARRAVAASTAHHRVAQVHGNDHRPWVVVGSIPLPSVLEVTLLRIDGRAHVPSVELFPTPLDAPAIPRAPTSRSAASPPG